MLAEVDFLILKWDFMHRHKLLVDLANGRLIDEERQSRAAQVKASAPTLNAAKPSHQTVLELITEAWTGRHQCEKCVWGASEVSFLGHPVSVTGVCPLPSQVEPNDFQNLYAIQGCAREGCLN